MRTKISKKDYTASSGSFGRLFFLTNRFKDGCYLGFYSGAPCGRCHNQERGWVVLSSKGDLLDEIETYDWGPVGDGFREWRKRQKEEHGPAKKLLDTDGTQKWKMTDE